MAYRECIRIVLQKRVKKKRNKIFDQMLCTVVKNFTIRDFRKKIGTSKLLQIEKLEIRLTRNTFVMEMTKETTIKMQIAT